MYLSRTARQSPMVCSVSSASRSSSSGRTKNGANTTYPDTQIEVYAYHPGLVGSATKYKSGWVEVATFGIYSPTALSQYDIPYPVMNLGLGVERIAMILHNSQDVRALSYPQFQANWELTAREMAQMILVDKTPSTPAGREIANAVVQTSIEHGETASPCEFLAWEGELFGRKFKVSVVEPEENTKLCGPAALNEIVVYKQNIMGIPHTSRWEEAFSEGVTTGIRYIDSFAALAAYEIEVATMAGKESETRARIVRSPGDINVKIHPALERYITSYKHKMDLRGPMFTTVKSQITRLVVLVTLCLRGEPGLWIHHKGTRRVFHVLRGSPNERSNFQCNC